MALTGAERERYARQMILPGWGEAAQETLRKSTVFIAGAGGLGSPAAMYLAAAGVGRLRIADCDAPDRSNLNRQILHDDTRIGINKALSARRTLTRLNPHVQVEPLPVRIEAGTVDRLVGDAAVVVDCLDNFATRFLLNDAARRKGVPFVHGCVWGMGGRLTVLRPPVTPCLRCLVREAPPAEVFPVVGVAPGVIGSLQALEVLKCLTGLGRPLLGRLLLWDGETGEFRTLTIHRDPACASCGAEHTAHAA